ncbi:MAG: glycosyltransferase family 1 protein [Cyanobacteria bacterium J06560_6]
MKIVQIVPRIPPSIDGVGDYALNLARQLRKDFDVETYFVICDTTSTHQAQIENFPVIQLSETSSDELCSTLFETGNIIILHYVGYGYHLRGVPVWLIKALERLKQDSKYKLITMFHEVHTWGTPFWSSSFWLSLLQKKLVKRLSLVSDFCLTSMKSYAQIIHNLSSNKHRNIPTIPVFSTIGEAKETPSLARRSRKLVVFGSCSNRKRIYTSSLDSLNQACRLLDIVEVIDIGRKTGLALSSFLDVRVSELGEMPSSEISEILEDSLAGLFDYFDGYLAKSTIFAAYCAHGVLPISAKINLSSLDGIEPNQHYYVPDIQANLDFSNLTLIAANSHRWYKTHDLKSQASAYHEILKKCL